MIRFIFSVHGGLSSRSADSFLLAICCRRTAGSFLCGSPSEILRRQDHVPRRLRECCRPREERVLCGAKEVDGRQGVTETQPCWRLRRSSATFIARGDTLRPRFAARAVMMAARAASSQSARARDARRMSFFAGGQLSRIALLRFFPAHLRSAARSPGERAPRAPDLRGASPPSVESK